MSSEALEGLVKRLETAVSRLEAVSASAKPALAPKPGSAGSTGQAPAGPPPSVVQYDDAVESDIKAFLEHTQKIGGDIGSIGPKIKEIFNLLRNYIWWAAGVPEPPMNVIEKRMLPFQKLIGEIADFAGSKRNTPHFNHLSSVADGIGAVGWITVKPTPGAVVKDAFEASMFYVNRVRKDHKGDAVHENWVKAWIEIFNNMQKYVRQVHTTGLVFNSAPGTEPPASAASAPAAAPSKAAAGGPPPPPPPPPADFFADINAGAAASPADNSARAALFADLNKGQDVTSRLKKVTADQMTHKNPTLRGSSMVPAASASKPGAAGSAKPAAAAPVKPPRTELENFKNWAVEYHKNNPNIQINVTDVKQTVYVLKCEGSVVQIKGKVNSVVVDGCKKTSVVFDNLLSQVEVINSQSIQVQTMGTLPTISIQKTDGCQVYLSKDSLGAEIVTSKSSEMNVLVPVGDDGEFIEFPIPEQFKTTFDLDKKKITTTVSDIV